MIKYVLISRMSDGLILCQTSEGGFNQAFETLKIQVKTYHKDHTSKLGIESTSLKQIDNFNYGIYYRVESFVVYTAITESSYPVKLINGFLGMLVSAFMDEAKCILGSTNIQSRIENIEGSHFFVRFDRTIKLKKKQFDDPRSVRNVDRMKKELETIQEIMKENMGKLDDRHQDLLNVQEKAYEVNMLSNKFYKKSKELVWTLWIKKNIIWLVLILGIVILYFVF